MLIVDNLMGDIAESENGTMMDKKPKLLWVKGTPIFAEKEEAMEQSRYTKSKCILNENLNQQIQFFSFYTIFLIHVSYNISNHLMITIETCIKNRKKNP